MSATYCDWFNERYGEVGRDGGRRGARSVQVGDSIEDLVDHLHGTDGKAATTYRAIRLWRRMSDLRVRDHTDGVFLDRGKNGTQLNVYVDHSVWVYEFDMRKEALLAEWNHLCEASPDLRAQRIAVRLSARARNRGEDGAVSGTAAWEAHVGRGSHADLLPLDAGEREHIEGVVGAISDPELRRKAQTAIEMTMRRQKTDGKK